MMKKPVNDPKVQENLNNLADNYFKFIKAPEASFQKLHQITAKYVVLKYNRSVSGILISINA
jgi:hypothetical protein